MTQPPATLEQAKANARTWLLRAIMLMALHVFVYFASRGTWDGWDWLISGATWWCTTEWSEWRGYAKGWQAHTRERQHHG